MSNEGILLPQCFAGGMKELCEIILFQRGKLCPNRRAFNFLLFYGLNPLQLTQEKEKRSVDLDFPGCVNIFLLEWGRQPPLVNLTNL